MKAIYPGSFDPITLGHLDVIRRAAPLFKELIIAVAGDTCKNAFFSLNERVDLLAEVLLDVDIHNVKIAAFCGLLVNFTRYSGAQVIVRGVRAVSDFEYEFKLAHMNNRLAKDISTIFLPSTEEVHFISSSFVKEIARLGGDVSEFVPICVKKKLHEKLFGDDNSDAHQQS